MHRVYDISRSQRMELWSDRSLLRINPDPRARYIIHSGQPGPRALSDREIRSITEPWMTQLSVLINSSGTERKLHDSYGVNQSA